MVIIALILSIVNSLVIWALIGDIIQLTKAVKQNNESTKQTQ